MLIGIDASRALRPNRTGTEVYNAEIIKHLVKIDSQNTYRLYASVPPSGDMLNLGPNVEWKVMPFSRGWTLVRLSWEMLWHQPDVLFIPAHTLPLIPAKKTVVMIHDVGWEHFPDLYKKTDILYHKFAVHWAKLWAKHIIVPSEDAKRDVSRRFTILPSRISVVHHGYDATGFQPAPPNEPSPESVPYFYFVGRIEYKKNISRMLHAFALFKKETGLPHKFILAGRPAHGYETVMKHVESLGPYKADVQFLGYVDNETNQRYLRQAQIFLFCTLFEGFGIPVLDAFASGVPVITSNTTSLPEIAGDAALLVSPTKVTEIAQAMAKLAQSPSLCEELIRKGHHRVTQFSWDKAAQATLAIVEKTAKQ